MITVIPYNYIVSHYFIEVRLASLVDTHTPRNRADEEERVKANAFLSLSLSLSLGLSLLHAYCVYTGKEQSLLSTTREIGSIGSNPKRVRVCACGLSIRVRTHTRSRYVHAGWSIVRRKLRKRKLAGVTVTGADVSHVLLLRFCNQ